MALATPKGKAMLAVKNSIQTDPIMAVYIPAFPGRREGRLVKKSQSILLIPFTTMLPMNTVSKIKQKIVQAMPQYWNTLSLILLLLLGFIIRVFYSYFSWYFFLI